MKFINFPGRIKGEVWEQDSEFSCSGISYVCVRVTVSAISPCLLMLVRIGEGRQRGRGEMERREKEGGSRWGWRGGSE